MSVPLKDVGPRLVVGRDPLDFALPDPGGAHARALERWRAHRLGIFVHWGIDCRSGFEISYSRGRERSVADYDAAAGRFDPTAFSADRWAEAFAASGAGYVVFGTRHADGFAWWPTGTQDYHVGATPFGRDLVGELAAACRRAGLNFGCYLSVADWRHPDYGVGTGPGGAPKTPVGAAAWGRHLGAQATELLERYGPLLCLWFDAEWDWCWDHEAGLELYRRCRALQPDVLVNDRVDRSRQGMRGLPQGSVPADIPRDWLDPLLYTYLRTPRPDTDYAGDFRTVENELGSADGSVPWEACLMMGTTWSWNPHGPRLSPAEVLRHFVHTVGGDGNLLLNVSPDPEGRIPDYQRATLGVLGRWLAVHGDAVLGTRGGPWAPGAWGASTRRGDDVFVFAFDERADALTLPSLEGGVERATALRDGRALEVADADGELRVELPAATDDEPRGVRLERSSRGG